MKIVVTGAGGFVGGWLVPQLMKHGHTVSALGIGTSEILEHLSVPVHEVDILDVEAVRDCLSSETPDAVIHLAAISNVPVSWAKPQETIAVNVEGTVNVLSALAEVNPNACFLNIGSSDEYGLTAKEGKPLTEDMPCRPQNPYSISKLCAEQMVIQIGKKNGVRVVSTRSFNHFGPGQAKGFVVSDFASQIAAIERDEKEPVLHVGDLNAWRDFSYVGDVVAAYVALVESETAEGVYNVCSGEAIQVKDMLRRLLSMSRASIRVEQDTERFRPSEVPYFVGDGTRCKSVICESTGTDVDEGLARTLDWWRKNQ